MLKTLAVSTLLLGSTIAFAQPAGAWGRSDNRNNNSYSYSDNRGSGENRAYSNNRGYSDNRGYSQNRGYSENRGYVQGRGDERSEWQEHERFENRYVPYASSYRAGFGDSRYGYYDRFGNWCSY
jgi:hypothetical protein